MGRLMARVLRALTGKREARNEKRETKNEKRATRNERRETRIEKRESSNGLSRTQGGMIGQSSNVKHLTLSTRKPGAKISRGVREPRGFFALENLERAWRKVRANGGGAGVDGETLRAFEKNLRVNLETLARDLEAGEYKPQPVHRVYVPKGNGERRPLTILTVRDRITQRAVYDALAPQYEKKFLDCSYGFREGRSLHDAVEAIERERVAGKRWVVDGDIKDCFERIDHALLLEMLRGDQLDGRVLWLIEQWLKARVFNETPNPKKLVGTFQGGVISPLLANIYLHAFDVELTQKGLTLFRYADDWIVLTSKKAEAEAAYIAAEEALSRLRLAINPYKTGIKNFDKGFVFLGVYFVGGRHSEG